MDLKVGGAPIPEEPQKIPTGKAPQISVAPSTGASSVLSLAEVNKIVGSVKDDLGTRGHLTLSASIALLYKQTDSEWVGYFCEGIKEYDENTQEVCWQVLSVLTSHSIDSLRAMSPDELKKVVPDSHVLLDRLMEAWR